MTACGPGHFPMSGWFVHAWNGDDDIGGGLYRLVLDAASQEIVAKDYLEMGPRARMEQGISLKYVGDFDANGIDEVLELHETSGQGIIDTFLIGLLVSGVQFREALSVLVNHDDAGFHDDSDKITICQGSAEIQPPQGLAPRILRLKGKVERGAKAHDNDCISGLREFVLVNGTFVVRQGR